jgi:translocator protein
MTSGARQWAMLAVFVVICFAAAGVGSLATSTSVGSWYQTLRRPSWNPPDWIFGPVWSSLYLSMAVAAWLVWRRGSVGTKYALLLFFVQLGLNVLWSVIFFGLRLPGQAFAEIIALWVAILLTTAAFWRSSALAGALLLPYLVWVSFAAILNYTIWQLNRI